MKSIYEIVSRLEEKEKTAARIRYYIENPESYYAIDDLKEELEIVKQDIRTLRWILD